MGRIHKVTREEGRRVVVAVDPPSIDIQQLRDFLSRIPEGVAAVKIGLPYIIHYGIRQVSRLIRDYPSTYFIADLKLADIGDIMALSVKEVMNAGFHGVVAHAFTGVIGGLDRIERRIHESGMDLILQLTMSHTGASRTFDRVLGEMKEIINKVSADALVIPANKESLIRDIRRSFGLKHVILSPGIMLSGVSPGEAICAGADAEVIGRYAFSTRDPVKAIEDILRMQDEYLRARKDICFQMT